MSRKKSEYSKLKTLWYKKLKAEGFVDIEHEDGSINSGVPRTMKYKNPQLRDATQEYYYIANNFLHNYKFACELDKIMWEYHSNGISIRNIVALLHQTKVTKTNRVKVWKTLKTLEKIMKGFYLDS